MKLFQNLIVAPATLGLLCPLAVSANEVDLANVSNYSSSKEIKSISEFNDEELAITNSRVDGLEARLNDFEAGSFSETTTASFAADFVLGSVDGSTESEALQAGYSFGMKLATSFTGDDALKIAFDAGNSKVGTLDEFGKNSTTDDQLIIDGISYTFPLGDSLTAFVGDTVDGSMLFNTACVYGGPSDTLDDCGNVNSAIGKGSKTAAGASYDFGNGVQAAVGYTGGATGLGTLENSDAFAGQVSYSADSYGFSATYGVIDNAMIVATDDNNGYTASKYTALNAFFQPEGYPSISAGYEWGDIGGATDTTDESTSFFVGVSGEVGPGEAGFAFGTKTPTIEDTDEEYMYEVYYSYPINDGMTITPLLYTKENATTGVDDETGMMVKTSFKF